MFVDPLFSSRSLTENPFLRDHFQTENEESLATSNSHDNSCSISSEEQFDDLFEDNHSTFSINHENVEKDDLGAKIIKYAQDPFGPFDELADVDRMARILVIANGIDKENEARDKAQLNKSEIYSGANDTRNTQNRLDEILLDPVSGLDDLTSSRYEQVRALAGIANESNQLNKKAKTSSSQEGISFAASNIPKCEEDYREAICQNLEDMGLVKKSFLSIEEKIKAGIPKVNPNNYNGEDSHLILSKANELHEKRANNFFNFFRGMNDSVVGLTDFALTVIPGIKHSSEDFLGKHKLGQSEEDLESSFYYVMGKVAADYAVFSSIKCTATISGAIQKTASKIGQVMARTGLEAAVCMKLTTGAMGRGVGQYLTKSSGGTAVVPSLGAVARTGEAIVENLGVRVTEVLKNNPRFLAQNSEVATLVKSGIDASAQILNKVFVLASSTYYLSRINSSADSQSEVEVAHQIAQSAIQEFASDVENSKQFNEEVNQMLEASDNITESFEHYQNIVHQSQLRNFLKDLDCPAEAIPYIMRKSPSRRKFNTKALEETVERIANAKSTINFCDNYVKDPWIRNKLLELLYPIQKHHIFSDKSKKQDWTARFTEIFDYYGLNIKKHWNLVRIPHKGKHDIEYHQWCYDRLLEAHRIVQKQLNLEEEEKRQLLLEIIEETVKIPLLENPLLPMVRWYKFWKDEKLKADSSEHFLIKEMDTTLE